MQAITLIDLTIHLTELNSRFPRPGMPPLSVSELSERSVRRHNSSADRQGLRSARDRGVPHRAFEPAVVWHRQNFRSQDRAG